MILAENDRGNSFRLYRGPSCSLGTTLKAYAKQPVRAPHHTASANGILGTLRKPASGFRLVLTPGEIHLANHGVLVLTDLPEFRREVLERLAVTWKAGYSYHATPGPHGIVELAVPISFDIVATAQFCPCGASQRRCACSDTAKARFEDRITWFTTLLQEKTP